MGKKNMLELERIILLRSFANYNLFVKNEDKSFMLSNIQWVYTMLHNKLILVRNLNIRLTNNWRLANIISH